MRHKTINVPFQIKELSESGEFSGTASPYGVRDLGNDIVDPGAFTKTIAERGNKVRLLDGHETRIGVALVKDTPLSLEMSGQINIDKQAGRDAYSDLKFYRDKGLPMGLSIGYETVKSDPSNLTSDGARHLKEVRLWEISITEFPMNLAAQVTNVKHAKDSLMQQKDFNEALDNIQTWSARYDYMSALEASVCEAIRDEKLTTADAVAQVETAVGQFQQRMVELVPKLRLLMNETYGYDFKRLIEIEKKAGRRISADSRTKIEGAISELQALLLEEAAETTEEAAKAAAPPEVKGTSPAGAAAPETEPVIDHSAANQILDDMLRSLFPAA